MFMRPRRGTHEHMCSAPVASKSNIQVMYGGGRVCVGVWVCVGAYLGVGGHI